MPGLSASGTFTPGLASPGTFAPGSSESSKFDSSIFDIDIEEVLKKIQSMSSSPITNCNFPPNNFHPILFIFPLMQLLLTRSMHAREGYSSEFFVCLSVCDNNIWELTQLQPLKYAPNRRRPYFIGFKCAEFLTNAAVSEKKASQTWSIEIVLREPFPMIISLNNFHRFSPFVWLQIKNYQP